MANYIHAQAKKSFFLFTEKKLNCHFLFVLHRRNFSTDLTLICKTLLELERQVLN